MGGSPSWPERKEAGFTSPAVPPANAGLQSGRLWTCGGGGRIPTFGWPFNAIDNIRFSAEAIQEPRQATLLMIGAAALWALSRR